MTIASVVKQTQGDKYPTISLVLSFMNSCMRNLSEDAPIKQTWMGTANVCREFTVSLVGHKFERGQEEILSCVESVGPTHKDALVLCNKYFPPSWKDDVLGYLSMDLKSFYVQPTQGEVKDADGQVKHQAYMQVQQVTNDTDPLMWWKQCQQEFPDLTRMARQYLTVPATSPSPERFFSRVGLVQTDLCGNLLDTTMIDLMWAKQAP